MLGALAILALQSSAAPTYHLYVAAESADQVHALTFDGERLQRAAAIDVGYQATEIEGPHGLTVEPSGLHWYVTLAHGKPNGALYKYTTGTNELVGSVELGLYPASIAISPDTGLLYCVNFDLHGDMTPSSVSIVDVESMSEVARTVTGAMPHGSRLSRDGRHHYSVAMMSDELIELDAATFAVSRRLKLDDGSGLAARIGAARGHGGAVTKPTWVAPHPARDFVYVALNGVHQIVEVDLKAWRITRRIPTGRGPYNLDVTADGKQLVATYKGARAVGVIALEDGREVARIETSRRVPHGVVVPPDGRFAFVSCEGVGGEAGTVDAIDLSQNKRLDSIEVGLQAAGLALWKVEVQQ